MRRDKNDLEWKNLKIKVTKRDKSCRLLRVLTAKEMCLLLRLAPGYLLNRLDHAHVFGVGRFPHCIYNAQNVVLLNRYSHHNLDECRHPITGLFITKEEVEQWWKRIVGEERYEQLYNQAYNNNTNYIEENNMEEKMVILDEKTVTEAELNEVKQDRNKRVIMESPDKYRTLNKLED